MDYEYITDADRLSELASSWLALEFLGIDTEFIRERSYYPALCLMQIQANGALYVIDIQAVGKVAIMRDLLRAQSVVKVIHACGEDLDALFHHFHVLPTNIFDTQMAAALLDTGPQVGYGHLVAHYFDETISKEYSRTDWMARPLSPEQLRYAADDVRYLDGIYTRQLASMKEKKVLAYFEADCTNIVDASRYHPIPEHMYLKVKHAFSLNRKQLAVLRELAAWRELKARQQNLPRGFIVKDPVLIEIAKLQPRNTKALSTISALRAADVRRYGDRLLACVSLAQNQKNTDWPPAIPRVTDIDNYKVKFSALKTAATRVAEASGVPLHYLANRKFIENFMLLDAGLSPLVRNDWQGWRKALLAEPFQEALAG